jgi:DNA processing protein
MDEKIFANALNHVSEFGPKSLERVRINFAGFKKAWQAPVSNFTRIPQLNSKGLESLEALKKNFDPEKEYQELEKGGVKVLLRDEIPSSLKETPAPPEVLYVRGSLPPENLNYLGIVGTRRYSSYGREAVINIVDEFRDKNFVVVSGLAKGIDSIAHEAAIKNDVKTIAVLGSGLSPAVLFPKENKRLAEKIVEKEGAVISEYPYNMKANVNSFPQRNRIVAGLVRALFVVEAKEKSGALITAKYALDYNRDLCALPGSIFQENSKGPNELIKQGAIPVTSAVDIFNIFGIQSENSPEKVLGGLSEEEKKILEFITEPILKDQLIQKVGLAAAEVIPTLTLLEMKGIIKDSRGEIFRVKI